MPTHISITKILSDGMVSAMAEYMTFEEDVESEASAQLIRAGKLQDDPTIAEVNILVHPAKEDWKNELYTSSGVDGVQAYSSYGMRGAGLAPSAYWMQRFTVELRLFFDNEYDRPVAFEKSQVVLSRAHHALHMMNIKMHNYPRDSFGMKAHAVQVHDTYIREGGGEGTFIWRGELKVEFLCEFEPISNPV
jgi:hypothetical protein